MTLFVEVSKPFIWKPGRHKSRVMVRFWWGYIAVGWLHIPFHEFATTSYDWTTK